MLNNLKEKSMIACGCVVIFMMIVVLFGEDKPIKQNKPIIKNEQINNLFDKINDNYTLKIEENINNTITKYIYYKDSNIEFYEKENDNIGYLKYNNKNYSISDNDFKIKQIDNINFINDEYYNIKFINKIINKCEFEFIRANNVKCNLNRNEYYKEYNQDYNTNYGNDGNDAIEISIIYDNNIRSIKIDYSLNDDIKVYNLSLSNIDKTDFTFIKENYSDVLIN